jgi:anti-anti-sigma factor
MAMYKRPGKKRVNDLVAGVRHGVHVVYLLQTWLSAMTNPTQSEPPIHVERHGAIAVIIPSPEAAALAEQALEQVAIAALAPIDAVSPASIVMDLSRMDYFGSRFIGFLIRCHKLIKNSGGKMVLVGVSGRIRELLRLSTLDSVWPFYQDRAKAMQALSSTA